MSNTSSGTQFAKVLSLFDSWYKVCALLLCVGVALAGLGFAVQTGALTPDQANSLINNVSANLNERIDAMNKTLMVSWNPTFYTTSQPYSYVISQLSTYYCLQNGTTGALNYFSTNKTHVELIAVNNLTVSGGTVFLKQLQHSVLVTIPAGVLVWSDYGGTTPTLWTSAGEISLVGATGPTGLTGATGLTGLTGATGTAGSLWYSGAGAPAVGLGVNTDCYLNTATSDVYQKSGGAWAIIENIKGATGSTGATGASGVNAALYQPYSFMILPANSSGYYRAQNGTDGQIVDGWSSTNASYVYNMAMSNCPSGGTVFGKAGIYPLTAPILQRGDVTLMGEGGGYRWTPLNNGTVLILSGTNKYAISAIEGVGGAGSYGRGHVTRLAIDLNLANDSIGVLMQSMYDSTVDYCAIFNGGLTNSTGIQLGGVTGLGADDRITNNRISYVRQGVYQTPTTSDECSITDNFIDNTYYAAIHVQNGLNIISRNRILDGYYGIFIDSGKLNTVDSNVIDEMTRYPIAVGYGDAADSNSITNNIIKQALVTASGGIGMTIASSHNYIAGNHYSLDGTNRYYQMVLVSGGNSNIFIGNDWQNNGVGAGFVIEAGCLNNTVTLNDFSRMNIGAGLKIDDAGTASHIEKNIGIDW